MPVVTSGKVLVTGATGFIAGCVVETLLQHGYHVRGTVRSESKGAPLKAKLIDYGDKFEIAVVEDMAKEGAFDKAVKDIDAIMHVASPCHLDADDPNELIAPAIGGTVGVLASAYKCGDSVTCIVFTSSAATIITAQPEFRVFSEEDWNRKCLKEVEEKGRAAMPIDKYRASKTYAERAAWAFMEEHKADIKFEFVTIHPPWVFGPTLLATTPQDLNTSMRAWYETVCGGTKDDEYLATVGGEWVNVQDLARAHVLSIQKESAAGQRLIISAGPYKWQHWVNLAHEIEPKLPGGRHAPSNPQYDYRFDASKSVKLLGMEYASMEETTRDILSQFQRFS